MDFFIYGFILGTAFTFSVVFWYVKKASDEDRRR